MKQIIIWTLEGEEIDMIENNEDVNCVRKTYKDFSTESIKQIGIESKKEGADYILLGFKKGRVKFFRYGVQRMLNLMEEDGIVAMVYADYIEQRGTERIYHPTSEYQLGSIRDDFDFGAVTLWRTAEWVKRQEILEDWQVAGLYELRLSVHDSIMRMGEVLYEYEECDNRKSGEKQFDYVNPKSRASQIEMERVCTKFLRQIGGLIQGNGNPITSNDKSFEIEATIVIPVKNRVKTIGDAIDSARRQKTDFSYNIIVVDNYSSDGTTEEIQKRVKTDNRIIHIIPDVEGLGIGGCWNEALFHPRCGKFIVQLDSDDLYETEETLQKIVNKFHEEQCGMVIGSYTLTDIEGNPIPPGLIDHKEWTDENGGNNALRINGLGAPRAFYTPLLRQIGIPNVSYGEDYAVGLQIVRKARIGRIYDSLYLCRRWQGNSDAALTPMAVAKNNAYKDQLRTIELKKRIYLNAKVSLQEEREILNRK